MKKQITQTENITAAAKKCQTISPQYRSTISQWVRKTCNSGTMNEMGKTSENRDQDQGVD